MINEQLQAPSLASGQEFGGCRIVQSIGQSVAAEVYLAETLYTQEPVALKVLRADLAANDSLQHSLNELKWWSRFGHTNLVRIRRVGEEDGRPYVVMEYVPGETFNELVQWRSGPLPWRSSVRMIQLAARGLDFLHDGMIHRDVRPGNMVLTLANGVVLLEFGSAVSEEALLPEFIGSMSGEKVAFRSPEQCRGEPLDRRSNVYSLGTTLYYLLTAELPFSGSAVDVSWSIAEGKTPPPPVDELNPEVPSEAAQLVARIMAARRDDRPVSAAAVDRQCRKLLKEFPISPPRRRRHTGLVGGPPRRVLPGELLPLEAPWETLGPKLLIGTTTVLTVTALATCLIMFSL